MLLAENFPGLFVCLSARLARLALYMYAQHVCLPRGSPSSLFADNILSFKSHLDDPRLLEAASMMPAQRRLFSAFC